MFKAYLSFITMAIMIFSLQGSAQAQKKYKLLTLDPGHFHAALVQKTMYPQVDKDVHVYAPDGPELKAHLALVESYNRRNTDPTHWNEIVYTRNDYFNKMLSDKAGNLLVLAGNNKNKTNYILQSVAAGINVLADKPMAIDKTGFDKLQQAFALAAKNKVLIYDIMTERYDITNIIQRELMGMSGVFGHLEKGTPLKPAVVKESVHHFFKTVSGKPLTRPAWYFDTEQEGSGIVDVTTHLVDLVKWTCFPEQVIDYKKDIRISSAKQWVTEINRAQFEKSTQLTEFPDFLKKDVKNGVLYVYSNGEMNYTLKGVAVKITAIWNFEAPAGGGDTYYSLIKGTKANLIIRQGAAENYNTVLYVEPLKKTAGFAKSLVKAIGDIDKKFPGVALVPTEKGWKVNIPAQYNIGHEAQFAEVTKQYLNYLQERKMPQWEITDMISKYYTTISALEKSEKKN
ncbi:oxidoreductase [Mucilaginibacter boryungensis]|uniref:Oxidoreductase n=2 Tax=Mucilaginibacter boryungensis TaxID=768480 RepID=A0ABR9XDJ7_9SPHI|nr:oxidoreductase [Mucilaginibacter boryungensis]